jgi:hypothetical protein
MFAFLLAVVTPRSWRNEKASLALSRATRRFLK